MPKKFPTIESLFTSNPDWLLGAITTEAASDLLSIPTATLTTWRSRKSSGPRFVRIPRTRIIRYIRVDLYRWLFEGGLLDHNGGMPIPVSIPDILGKQTGSLSSHLSENSVMLQQTQTADGARTETASDNVKHAPANSRPSNSPRGNRGR
ncbi:hypothetical protein [Magnetospirillum sp. LM-5]|uniref:hypothetical protein n=1 Tax=Magnetospirillum sp. LM-5 TaxID=2681466 RepID=UPI00156E375E|nr:hypothetical protein [Magnetospirillum sp. LM-5]